MRTKTLLLSAAAMAAGLVSSVAQSNVYSANVVGYINFNLTNGFNLIANQLDVDGSKTNNNLTTVFGTNLPVNSLVYAYLPASAQFLSANYISTKTGKAWSGSTNEVNAALSNGGAVFVSVPSPTTLTIVGNVIQGTNVIPIANGYNLVGSIPPIAGGIQANLNYTPSVGDIVYVWNPATQTYDSDNYITTKTGAKWNPSEPQIGVGQGVFIQTTATPGWTNGIVVQ